MCCVYLTSIITFIWSAYGLLDLILSINQSMERISIISRWKNYQVKSSQAKYSFQKPQRGYMKPWRQNKPQGIYSWCDLEMRSRSPKISMHEHPRYHLLSCLTVLRDWVGVNNEIRVRYPTKDLNGPPAGHWSKTLSLLTSFRGSKKPRARTMPVPNRSKFKSDNSIGHHMHPFFENMRDHQP